MRSSSPIFFPIPVLYCLCGIPVGKGAKTQSHRACDSHAKIWMIQAQTPLIPRCATLQRTLSFPKDVCASAHKQAVLKEHPDAPKIDGPTWSYVTLMSNLFSSPTTHVSHRRAEATTHCKNDMCPRLTSKSLPSPSCPPLMVRAATGSGPTCSPHMPTNMSPQVSLCTTQSHISRATLCCETAATDCRRCAKFVFTQHFLHTVKST